MTVIPVSVIHPDVDGCGQVMKQEPVVLSQC